MATMRTLTVWFQLFILPVTVYGVCNFPDFLQPHPDIPGSHWLYKVMDQNNERSFTAVQTKVYFQGGSMMVKVKAGRRARNPPSPYNRTCEEVVNGDKFLVRHKDSTGVMKYTCMQFIQRTRNVVQMKEAELSSTYDISLCDDQNLLLDDWPMLEERDVRTNYHKCPLMDGFDLEIYDNKKNRELCADEFVPPRMESECLVGEGIVFTFPGGGRCMMRTLLLNSGDAVHCLASWTEGPYTFAVLRHAKRTYYWGLRFPTRGGSSFTAHLMKDVVFDRGASFSHTMNYLTLTMTSMKLGALCKDAFPKCTTLVGSCTDEVVAKHCPATCGLCSPDTYPTFLDFPSGFRGEWIKSTARGQASVKINTNTINIENFATFQPIQLSGQVANNLYPVVTSFANGCRPRFSCLNMENVTRSVIQYRVGISINWPLFSSETLCDTRSFRSDLPPLFDTYRSELLRNLVRKYNTETVPCDLRANYSFTTQVEGAACKGNLAHKSCYNQKEMTMKLSDCSAGPSTTTFSCLASYDGSGGGQFIVTEDKATSEIQCWNFPIDKPGTAYASMAGDCDDQTALRFGLGIGASPEYVLEKMTSTEEDCKDLPSTTEATTTTEKITSKPEGTKNPPYKLETDKPKSTSKPGSVGAVGNGSCRTFYLNQYLIIILLLPVHIWRTYLS